MNELEMIVLGVAVLVLVHLNGFRIGHKAGEGYEKYRESFEELESAGEAKNSMHTQSTRETLNPGDT